MNDGITRNFDYDAVITGTSMAENFKASEFDALFGTKSIKVAYAGGLFKEINDNLKKVFETHPNTKIVLRSLDTFQIIEDKDAMKKADYPAYLTNDIILDDVNYLLNKEILYNAVRYAASGMNGAEMTSFDDYANWQWGQDFDENMALESLLDGEMAEEMEGLTQKETNMVVDNITQNVISTVEKNPNCNFYFFFQPASVIYYQNLLVNGEYNKIWEAKMLVSKMLTSYTNVKLFEWDDHYELTSDYTRYIDAIHYKEDVNSEMLRWMYEEKGLLTKYDYQEKLLKCKEFYDNYNYKEIGMT